MKQFPVRQYNLEDNELWTKAGDVVYAMTRDETEFIARGITATDRDAFEAIKDSFEQFPIDAQYRTKISMAVDIKNAAKAETELLIQVISGYVQQKYGLRSSQYKYLGITGYGDLKEGLQITAARQTVNGAEEFLPDLADIGLTQAKIDELSAAILTYEEGRQLVAQREMERDEKTRERIDLGNELYEKLMKNCEVGKLIWENTNPAYYDDYIIYKTVHSNLSKVQNFAAVVTGLDVYDLTWDLVVNADNYEIEIAESSGGQPQGPWQVYQIAANPPVGFQANPGLDYWLRVRARDIQGRTGSWSHILNV